MDSPPLLHLLSPSVCLSLFLQSSVPISNYLPYLPVSMPFALPLILTVLAVLVDACRELFFPVLRVFLKAQDSSVCLLLLLH